MKCITSTALHIDICQLFHFPNHGSGKVTNLRATCELKVKNYGRAREDAESAIRLNAKDIKFHCVLTEALIGLKRFHQPLKACDEGLEVDAREPHLIIRRKDRMQKLSGRNSYFCNLCRM